MSEQWLLWRKRRAFLMGFGKISSIFFLLFAIALVDGVQALLRTPTDAIRLLAGESTGISGPCPIQNPVESDLELRVPKDSGLSLRLEGFFAGYLLGNGMWRAQLFAAHSAQTGVYTVSASWRGAGSVQRFSVHIYATGDDYRRASPAFCQRFLGFDSFWVASLLFLGGVIFATITVVLSRKNAALLVALGFAEIFRVKASPTGVLCWCSAHASTLALGEECQVLTSNGCQLGLARVKSQKNNVFCLESETPAITDGCLVCVCPKKGGLAAIGGEA